MSTEVNNSVDINTTGTVEGESTPSTSTTNTTITTTSNHNESSTTSNAAMEGAALGLRRLSLDGREPEKVS